MTRDLAWLSFLLFAVGCGGSAADDSAADDSAADAGGAHFSDPEASDDTAHAGGTATDTPGVSITDDSSSAPCSCAEGDYYVRLTHNDEEQLFDQPVPRAFLDAGYHLTDRALFDECSSVAQPSMHLGGSCRGDEIFACDSEDNCIVVLDDRLFVTDENGTSLLDVEFSEPPERQNRFPSEQNRWSYTAPGGINYEVEFKACVIDADLCLR